MPVYQAEGRWRFEFDRRTAGRRYRLTKLLPKGWGRSQAEAYDRKRCASLAAQCEGLTKERLTLAGAVKFYLEHRVQKLRNGKKAAQDLAHLYDIIESAALDEVSDIANRYQQEHSERLAPATIRNRMAYLKAAVRYAYKHHSYGDRDYTDRMNLPAANNERQVYARLPELNKLWLAIKEPEARALFKMVFYMGLRWRAELLPRVPGDVRRNGADTWLQIGVTKNGQPVMKPVHPAVKSYLRFLPFKHRDTWFYRHWSVAVKAIGRPDLRPHDLRHSLGSEIRSRGGTLEDVRSALHHISLQASNRYAHLYPEKARDILMAIGQKVPQSKPAKKTRKVRKAA